jgi:hypothetical protein
MAWSALLVPSLRTFPRFRVGLRARVAASGVSGNDKAVTVQPARRRPFHYPPLLWETISGFVFRGDLPTPDLLLGSAIGGALGLCILWHETMRRRAVRTEGLADFSMPGAAAAFLSAAPSFNGPAPSAAGVLRRMVRDREAKVLFRHSAKTAKRRF